MRPVDSPAAIWVEDAQGLAAEDVEDVVAVLITEFAGRLPDRVVIEHVVVACQQLVAAGVLAGLGPATESMARARLRADFGGGGAE